RPAYMEADPKENGRPNQSAPEEMSVVAGHARPASFATPELASATGRPGVPGHYKWSRDQHRTIRSSTPEIRRCCAFCLAYRAAVPSFPPVTADSIRASG